MHFLMVQGFWAASCGAVKMGKRKRGLGYCPRKEMSVGWMGTASTSRRGVGRVGRSPGNDTR